MALPPTRCVNLKAGWFYSPTAYRAEDDSARVTDRRRAQRGSALAHGRAADEGRLGGPAHRPTLARRDGRVGTASETHRHAHGYIDKRRRPRGGGLRNRLGCGRSG